MAAKALPGVKELVTFPPGPNPMVIDIALREKGVDPAAIERWVDLPLEDNRDEKHLMENPQGSTPWFVMSDGTVIAETAAMIEYVEEVIPDPPLIGHTPQARAWVRMWQRRMEEHYLVPAYYGHRFWTSSDACEEDHFMRGFFEKRLNGAKYGALLIPKAWDELLQWARNRIIWLERIKQEEGAKSSTGKPTDYIAGDEVSAVDIQVYICLWFFGEEFPHPPQPILQDLKGELPWVQAWYDRMGEREAVKASKAYRVKSLEEKPSKKPQKTNDA